MATSIGAVVYTLSWRVADKPLQHTVRHRAPWGGFAAQEIVRTASFSVASPALLGIFMPKRFAAIHAAIVLARYPIGHLPKSHHVIYIICKSNSINQLTNLSFLTSYTNTTKTSIFMFRVSSCPKMKQLNMIATDAHEFDTAAAVAAGVLEDGRHTQSPIAIGQTKPGAAGPKAKNALPTAISITGVLTLTVSWLFGGRFDAYPMRVVGTIRPCR